MSLRSCGGMTDVGLTGFGVGLVGVASGARPMESRSSCSTLSVSLCSLSFTLYSFNSLNSSRYAMDLNNNAFEAKSSASCCGEHSIFRLT